MQSVADQIERIIFALTDAVKPLARVDAGQDQETPSEVEQPREAFPPKEAAGQECQAGTAAPEPPGFWIDTFLQARPGPRSISIQHQARMIANNITRPAIPLPHASEE